MHKPADIGGKLLRLGAGQEHAVVERVQKPILRNPPLLLDQDAVHDRYLAGGAAEAEECDTRPDMHRLLHRNLIASQGARSGDCG